MKAPLKVLIAGMGSVGQRHARNLRQVLGNNVELWAYRVRGNQEVITANLSVVAGEKVDSFYGVRVFLDLKDALSKKPDVVFVTNPNHLHMQVALEAAKAGCHLFIEKPISHNEDGIAELKKLVEQQRLTCFVGYQLRFHPGYHFLKTKLPSVGRVLSVQSVFGEYVPGWHPYEDYRTYHAVRREQGGGVLLSQIHDLDYLYGLFGTPQQVWALGGKWSDLPIDVEDSCDVMMKYQTGDQIFPVYVHQDYLQKPLSRSCTIIGDKGKLFWDYAGRSVSYENFLDPSASEKQTFADWDRNEMFVAEIQHFLRCLQKEEKPLVSLDDAVQSLRMALAAKKSIESHQVVELGHA